MDVKNTYSVTKTEISVFGRQALDAERRRSPSLADKVLMTHALYFNFAILLLTLSHANDISYLKTQLNWESSHADKHYFNIATDKTSESNVTKFSSRTNSISASSKTS